MLAMVATERGGGHSADAIVDGIHTYTHTVPLSLSFPNTPTHKQTLRKLTASSKRKARRPNMKERTKGPMYRSLR